MPHKLTKGSGLKSGPEETDWYATAEGRDQTKREFIRALREGTLSRSSGLKAAKTDGKILEQLMRQAKEKATRAISIRIPLTDLERAEHIASKTGVGYQTVLKRAIREGLKKAG